jgi:hypothetical protein
MNLNTLQLRNVLLFWCNAAMYSKKFFKSLEPSDLQKNVLLNIKDKVQKLRAPIAVEDITKKKEVATELNKMLYQTMAVSKNTNTDNNLKIAVLFLIADIYACTASHQKKSTAIETLKQLHLIFADIKKIYKECTTPDVALIVSLNNWGISNINEAEELLKTEMAKLEEPNQDQAREYINKTP